MCHTDLPQGSFAPQQFVENSERDTEHGGQSQCPAKHFTPQGVSIHCVVRQGLVVHHMEQEHSLYAEHLSAAFKATGKNEEKLSRAALTTQTNGVM